MTNNSEKNLTTLLPGVEPNTFWVKRINNVIVFTKSVNSNFRTLWLAPATRNILGYSLLCDWSQDDVSFEDIIYRETKVWAINEAVVQTNTPKATDFSLSVFYW